MCFGQSAQVPLTGDTYRLLDRLEVKSGVLAHSFHSVIKPYQRKEIAAFIQELEKDTAIAWSLQDKWNLEYLMVDNWEFLDSTKQHIADSKSTPLKYLYKKKNDAYYFSGKDFDIHVSPIFNFSYGRNRADEGSQNLLINTRGVELRGTIGEKVGFYTYFTENQSHTPFYIRDYSLAANSFSYYGLTKIVDDDSVSIFKDFLGAEGYLFFQPSEHFRFRFGQTKSFVGSGLRSLVLSNFTAPFLQLNSELRLGKLQYLSLVGVLADTQVERPIDNSVTIPPKYMAFHHLNLNVTPKLNIGLFEKVMFGRENGFDLNYLNPIILYRFVEGYLGSSDNALLGLDFRYSFLPGFLAYGQFILDEFNGRQFKEDNWWGRKYAGQIGLKVVDLFKVKQLDVQGEINFARPYTFTHYSSGSNGVHYGMPLGHPLGANFREFIGRVHYQPVPRLLAEFTYMHYLKGLDKDGLNYGGDIQKNNRLGRPLDYGVVIGQGLESTVNLSQIELSYMLKHNLFLTGSFLYRNNLIESGEVKNEMVFRAGVRLNFGREEHLF